MSFLLQFKNCNKPRLQVGRGVVPVSHFPFRLGEAIDLRQVRRLFYRKINVRADVPECIPV